MFTLKPFAEQEAALRPMRAQGDRIMTGICWALCLISAVLAPVYNTWLVCILGAVPLAAIVTLLALNRPGSSATRLTVAFAFMTYAAFFIHQLHGLIEMHFSVFVLLAFLLFYRDWRPIVLAAGVIAAHHFVFSQLQMSGYAVYLFPPDHTCSMVWVHAAFVIFQAALLIYLGEIIRAEALESASVSALGEAMASGQVIDLALTGDTGTRSQGLTRFLEAIETSVAGASDVAGRIGSVSLQMTEDARRLVDLGSIQNSASTDVLSTIHRMSDATASIVTDCNRVSTVVESSSALLQTGRATMAQTVTLMQTLDCSVAEVAKQIEDMHQESAKIESIIRIISEIADKTALLALNAAIEAARAGEFGSGFSVVAKEVRDLSNRTLTSLAEAQQVVDQVRSRTAGARAAADRCREDATRGGRQVDDANTALSGVVEQLPGIVERTAEVIRVAGRHKSLAAEIVSRLDSIGSAIGTSAGTLAHFGGLSAELRGMASELCDSVSQFRPNSDPPAPPPVLLSSNHPSWKPLSAPTSALMA